MPRLVPPVLEAGTLAGSPQPVLDAGDDLSLRPWAGTDAPVLVAAHADPDVRHWHHRSMTLEEASDWITEADECWSLETRAEWAVARGGDVVGRVGLHIRRPLGLAEVSYWTLPHARGAGVARRAVDRAAGWALDEVGFWRLELRHSTLNPASCRVAVAAGFPLEAQLARCHVHDDGWHDVHVHTRFRSSSPAPCWDRP